MHTYRYTYIYIYIYIYIHIYISINIYIYISTDASHLSATDFSYNLWVSGVHYIRFAFGMWVQVWVESKSSVKCGALKDFCTHDCAVGWEEKG